MIETFFTCFVVTLGVLALLGFGGALFVCFYAIIKTIKDDR